MKFAKFLRPPVLKNISCSCFHSFGKISVNLSVPMKLLLYKRGRERERERERVYCTRDSNFLNNLIYLLTFFTFIYIYKLNFLAFLLPAVNCYHKELHLGCCSSPRSASEYCNANQRAASGGALWKRCSYKFRKINRKTPVLEPLS